MKPLSEMSMPELIRLRSRIDMQLQLRMLGDPRKSFTIDATAPEAGQELKTASEPNDRGVDPPNAVAPRPEKEEK